ncbi:hypothetical protein [Chitinimonas naiadis]
MLSALVSVVIGLVCVISTYGSLDGPRHAFADQQWMLALIGFGIGCFGLYRYNSGKVDKLARPLAWLGMVICVAALIYMGVVGKVFPFLV